MSEAVKVLVIDDSEDDRYLYRRALQASAVTEYRLIEKDNGEDGLNCIAEEQPACILLDYSLPGRNGIEVLKRIRAKHPFVAVVMLTGQGNETVAVSAMREGAQHYISKTAITPETLQRSVRVATEHCNLQRHIAEQRASLEMFTRALAHDLKEPVRTIRSFIELILRQNLPPEKSQKYFEYIQQAAERMGSLIETVYFYMRLDNAAQEIAREACDSGQALSDAKENLAALIKDRKAVITSDPLPMVQANRMQLIQVIQNLLGNAINHCETTPIIHVSAAQDGERWLFRITDNGPGIDSEYREKIFEPFKRLVHHKEDGLGLGLAICKKIVNSCGGKIWCEAAPERGTVFCFTFPAAEVAPAVKANSLPHADQSQLPCDDEALAGILIVEDNEADVELIRFALLEEHKLRCHLSVTRNGQEAFAKLNDKALRGPIDLILLDINMPGMDGLELLAHMRDMKTPCSAPVVMCTTSTYDRDMEQAKALGAAGYLVKPFDFAKLRPLLKKMPSLLCCEDVEGCTLKRAANG